MLTWSPPSLPLPPPPFTVHFTVHWGALPAVAFPKKAADTLLVPSHWRFGCCCCCKGSGHCRGGSWGGGSRGGRAPDHSLPWQLKTDPRNKEKKRKAPQAMNHPERRWTKGIIMGADTGKIPHCSHGDLIILGPFLSRRVPRQVPPLNHAVPCSPKLPGTSGQGPKIDIYHNHVHPKSQIYFTTAQLPRRAKSII